MDVLRINHIPGDIVASIIARAKRNYRALLGDEGPELGTEYDLVAPWDGSFGLTWTNSSWVLWEMQEDEYGEMLGMLILHGDLPENDAQLLASLSCSEPKLELERLRGN